MWTSTPWTTHQMNDRWLGNLLGVNWPGGLNGSWCLVTCEGKRCKKQWATVLIKLFSFGFQAIYVGIDTMVCLKQKQTNKNPLCVLSTEPKQLGPLRVSWHSLSFTFTQHFRVHLLNSTKTKQQQQQRLLDCWGFD